jgi:hypothetical protein
MVSCADERTASVSPRVDRPLGVGRCRSAARRTAPPDFLATVLRLQYDVDRFERKPSGLSRAVGTATTAKEQLMRRKAVWGVAAVAVAMILPSALRAQVQSLKDYHVADVENLRSKFTGLAVAFPEDLYDWKPMEGTRSVRDVLVLVAAEANVFPANWGLPAAEGAAQGYQAESARVGGLAGTKTLLIAQLDRSFDHLSRSIAGMSDAARAADGRTFGRDMKVDAGITLALSDMHEHLGQLIAYARMNRIAPPWSR